MHTLALALSAAALLGVAVAARGRGASGGARRAGEVAWSVVLTLLLAEVGATLVGLGRPAPDVDPEAAQPKEAVALTLQGQVVREDWVRPRAAQPVVAFVGDSFTAGQGVEVADALPDQVRVALASRGLAIDDRNDGQPGDSFLMEAARYTSLYATQDPDVVVWVFVLNDFGLVVPDATDDWIVDRAQATRSGVRLIDGLTQAVQARALSASTEAAYRAALRPDAPAWPVNGATLRALVDERRAAGGRFLVVIYPLLHALSDYPFVAEHARVAAWAQDAGAEVVDLGPVFQGQDEATLWVSRQDHHPNAVAHAKAAAAVAEVIATGGVPRARPTDCARLPGPDGLVELARAACDRRDVSGALALAEAASTSSGQGRPLAGLMAAVAAWRAVGTPDEAAVRARASAIVDAAR
jgi:hypothetical protein